MKKAHAGKTTPRSKPKFGGGILADSVSQPTASKPSASGVFTMFLAWAYPCDRSWHIVATLFDLPKGKISCLAEIRQRGSRRADQIGTFTVRSNGPKGNVTVPAGPFAYRFRGPGRYEVRLSFKTFDGHLLIPFDVQTKAWPEFSDIEREFVRKNESLGHLRAVIECPKCHSPYNFEERILDETNLSTGVRAFPASGAFACEKCATELPLRDIQGQIRTSLKERLAIAMGRRR